MERSLVRLGKWLSLVLRHRPKAFGVRLNCTGWARVDDLPAAARMHADGHPFFFATNGVWLTDAVPPAYLSSET